MTTQWWRIADPITLFALAALAGLAWEIGSDGNNENLKLGGEIAFIIAAILLVAVSVRQLLRRRDRTQAPPS